MERSDGPSRRPDSTGRRIGSSPTLTAGLSVPPVARHRRPSTTGDGCSRRADLTGRRVGTMRRPVRSASVVRRGRGALIFVSWAVSLHLLRTYHICFIICCYPPSFYAGGTKLCCLVMEKQKC